MIYELEEVSFACFKAREGELFFWEITPPTIAAVLRTYFQTELDCIDILKIMVCKIEQYDVAQTSIEGQKDGEKNNVVLADFLQHTSGILQHLTDTWLTGNAI